MQFYVTTQFNLALTDSLGSLSKFILEFLLSPLDARRLDRQNNGRESQIHQQPFWWLEDSTSQYQPQ